MTIMLLSALTTQDDVSRLKEVMINALSWGTRASGRGNAGGFLFTHPANKDRLDEQRELR